MKTIPEKQSKTADLINLSILLAIALIIGVYLLATATIMSKDGVTFIEYAQRLQIMPTKAMMHEDQHPGYPALILAAHKTAAFFGCNSPVQSWVWCAQSVTLLFRLLAIVMLYFIGKPLLRSRWLSFWAVLIFVLLPSPAKYGSDALSDWPHLFFLAAGILLLMLSATKGRWWMFGITGLVAGMGYLVRPECSQVIVAGLLWLTVELFLSSRLMSKGKTLAAAILIIAGFLVAAGPYMHLKGAIFPKKNTCQFAQNAQTPAALASEQDYYVTPVFIDATPPGFVRGINASNITKAIGKIGQNTGETMMWFFLPIMLLGIYAWLRERKCRGPECFFVIVLFGGNMAVLVWLYCRHGYISDRHILPLLLLPILCMPVGMEQIAAWLKKGCPKNFLPAVIVGKEEHIAFFVLALIGISICVPKLAKPIHADKYCYVAAAKWLEANTDSTATVATPDRRIIFYAQRRGLIYELENLPQNTTYTVQLVKKQKNENPLIVLPGKKVYKYTGVGKKGIDVIIYRNFE